MEKSVVDQKTLPQLKLKHPLKKKREQKPSTKGLKNRKKKEGRTKQLTNEENVGHE